MKTPTIDYSKYRTVPMWSDLPQASYVVRPVGGKAVNAATRFDHDIPTWNIFWALAERVHPNSRIKPIALRPLPVQAEAQLDKVASYQYRISPQTGTWTLAAMMCKLPPEAFMLQFYPLVSSILKLPIDRGHIFMD